jgi:hypothetical protein
MSDAVQNPTFAVDTEHSALRFTIMLVFIVGWFISYMILNALVPSQGLNIIAIVVSFILTAVGTQQIERVLKQRWPSGRTLTLDHNTIKLSDRNNTQQIDANQQVNVLMWRFEIKRRSRVPKGWYMVACALEQEDTYLAAYTFMSPETFDALKTSHFTVLPSLKETEKTQGVRNDIRLMGEQRRLHAAENARWMNGAEMTNDDFIAFVRQLQAQFPQWMPSAL